MINVIGKNIVSIVFISELSVQKTHFEKLFNFFDKYQTIETRIDDSYTVNK